MGERSACPRCSAAVDSLCCMKGGELGLLAVVHGKKQGGEGSAEQPRRSHPRTA